MKSSSLPALSGVVALLLLIGSLGFAWWERSQTPSAELLVEVLPEEILEVAPPDWDALAREMEEARQENAAEESPAEESPDPSSGDAPPPAAQPEGPTP